MHTIDPHKIGQRVKAVRIEHKLSQAIFAERLGLKQSAISAIEKGERVPTTEQIILAINEFGYTADWWLFGIDETTTGRPHTVADKIENYSPESLIVADMFEVKVEGKTAQERLDFIREIMDTIRKKG